MSTPAELFAQAWQLHQTNDLRRAEQLYQQVLQADPCHADAWCFLGAVRQSLGKLDEAQENFRRALHLVPNYTVARNCLGVALAQQGKLDEAADTLQQLLVIQPADAEAHNNLGLVRTQQGNFDAAVECFQRALQLLPNFPAARANLNAALDKQRAGPDRMSTSPRRDVRSVAEAVYAANKSGVALAKQGRLDAARQQFEQALQLQPDDSDSHNNLGSLLDMQDKFEEAIAQYEEVLRLKPGHVEATYNLGVVYGKQDRDDDAEKLYRQVVRSQADHVDAQYNLGILLAKHGRLDEAMTHYDQALHFKPDYAEARWNRAMIVLLRGDFANGWGGYEWRWMQPGVARRTFSQPLWNGANLHGSTILLHAEQGLGDTLQFIRYAPLVKQRGGDVIVECQAPLLRLLANAPGIDRLVPRGSPLPAFDVQAPLLSLPGIFKTNLTNMPAAIPYLRADPDLIPLWRRELKPLGQFKIGIAWQGSPTFREDRHRSIPLAHFARLAEVRGVQLISLQRGPGTEQLAALSNKAAVHDLGDKLDAAHGPFMDTAAIMKNLDLVISSDTAVPHLAGALGVPVWVALPLFPDWRWLLERDDSPWYPSMRLFRQMQFGSWDEVFERMAGEVKQLTKC